MSVITARSMHPPRRLGFLRRHRIATGLVATPVLLVVVIWLVADWIDRDGLRFFDTGKATVALLNRLAGTLEKRDLEAAGALYSPAFGGKALGLTDLRLAEERDGIRTYRFHSAGSSTDRAA